MAEGNGVRIWLQALWPLALVTASGLVAWSTLRADVNTLRRDVDVGTAAVAGSHAEIRQAAREYTDQRLAVINAQYAEILRRLADIQDEHRRERIGRP